MTKPILFSIALICCTLQLKAQCNFTPILSPNTVILCPDGSSTLQVSDESYDSLRWYRWLGFNWDVEQEIVSAQNQLNHSVNYGNDAGFYFWVEAWKGGCMASTDTILVDGYVFLPLVAMTEYFGTPDDLGNYQIGCGDSAQLALMAPYTSNITWYLNGVPIPGATSPILPITETGAYTASAAPSVCPNALSYLGVDVPFEVFDLPDSLLRYDNGTLYAQGGFAWTWYLNNQLIPNANDSSLIPNPNESGYYQVKIDFGGGCIQKSDSIWVSWENIARIKAQPQIFPNPASERVFVQNGKSDSEFTLTAVTGQVLAQGRLSGNEIALQSLPSGCYILRLSQRGIPYLSQLIHLSNP
jgi:hypothetical protein